MVKRRKISIDTFIKRILSNERNFSNITLRIGASLRRHDGFAELSKYLKDPNRRRSLQLEPFVFDGASLVGVDFTGLFMPYLRANSLNLEGSKLKDVDFSYANLVQIDLSGTVLKRAILDYASISGNSDLSNANLQGASMRKITMQDVLLKDAKLVSAKFDYASLDKVHVPGADLYHCDFREADIRGVRKLSEAQNVANATFLHTYASDTQRSYINGLMKQRELFGDIGKMPDNHPSLK